MTSETAIIFAISLILLWIKPGPGQAFKITRALNDGFWPALYAAVGITTGCLIFFLVAVMGLKIVTEFFYDIRAILKFVGGVYFIFIGYRGLQNIRSGKWEERTTTSRKKSFLENYTAGLLLTFGNPLDIVYFLSIMPTLIITGPLQINDIAIGLSIIITVALIVDILVILLVGQVKEALSNTSFVKRLNIITSAGFLAIGLFLLYSALFMNNFSFEMI